MYACLLALVISYPAFRLLERDGSRSGTAAQTATSIRLNRTVAIKLRSVRKIRCTTITLIRKYIDDTVINVSGPLCLCLIDAR